MHQLNVMQRDLTHRQRDTACLGLIYLNRNFLAARQQIIFVEGIQMRQLINFVTTGYDLHKPVFFIDLGQGHPSRDDIIGI